MTDTLTVTDLENAALDTTTIAEVAMVGTSADTTANRDGVVLDTLQGRINKIGYEPPIIYAPGITFTDSQDSAKTVDYNGVVYASLPSARPFTTTNWAADSLKFLVVQDPANSGGNVRTDTDNTYDNGTTQDMSAAELVTATEWTYIKIADIADNGIGTIAVANEVIDNSATKATYGYEVEVSCLIERDTFTGDASIQGSLGISGFETSGNTVRANINSAEFAVSDPQALPANGFIPASTVVCDTNGQASNAAIDLSNSDPVIFKSTKAQYYDSGSNGSDVMATCNLIRAAATSGTTNITNICLKWRKVPASHFEGFTI